MKCFFVLVLVHSALLVSLGSCGRAERTMTDLFHFSKLWRTKDTCWTKKDVLSKAYNEMIVMSEAAVARLVIFEKSQLIDELDAAKQLVTERTFKALFGFKISDPTLQSFLELIKSKSTPPRLVTDSNSHVVCPLIYFIEQWFTQTSWARRGQVNRCYHMIKSKTSTGCIVVIRG